MDTSKMCIIVSFILEVSNNILNWYTECGNDILKCEWRKIHCSKYAFCITVRAPPLSLNSNHLADKLPSYRVYFFTCLNNCHHLEQDHKFIGSQFSQVDNLNELCRLIANKWYVLSFFYSWKDSNLLEKHFWITNSLGVGTIIGMIVSRVN